MNVQGSCTCGQISFEVLADLQDCSYCHCSICRKLTGSAFATYGAVERKNFRWLQGEELLNTFSPSERTTRYSCSVCSSFLLTEAVSEPDMLFVSLGALSNNVAIKMEYHQFFQSRAMWCALEDGLEKFPENFLLKQPR